jgi:RecA-family ATPase
VSLAQAITRHYGGEWHGTYGSFPAPGHSKGDRGMTVKDEAGAPDGVLINTFNGADPLAIKDDLRDAGILPPRNPGNDNQAQETGHYEYVDRDGVVLYRTVRIERPGQKKTFVAQLPDGRGGWVAGKLGDTPRVLYRLTDFRAAISTASLKDEAMPTIYLVEGERKADKLASWGLFATSCAFGCKGWRKSYAEDLAGCTVIILPDNDDEGRGFAERAAQDIEKARGTAHIIELPGLPDKGDIVDWTGTAEDLAALVEKVISGPEIEPFPIDDTADWDGLNIPPRRWLVEGWLPIGEAALLTGAGSVGKSLLSQQLGATIAAGQPFMGVTSEQAVTLYITCEDGKDEVQRRHAAIAAMLNTPIQRGACLVKSWKGDLDLELATFDAERRLKPTFRFKRLRATALAVGARLIILDNTSHLFGGDENVKREVAAFANLLNGLAAEIDGVVLLLGHPNKTGLNKPGEGDGNQFGGSVAWENQVRSRLFLATDSEDSDGRVLTNPKANYSSKGGKLEFRWHKGAFVRDDDLPAETRLEVAAVIRDNADNELFLECLRERNKQQRQVSEKSSKNYAPLVFAAMPESRKVGKKRLEAAMDRLFRIGRIERAELWRGDDRKMIFGLRETPIWGAGNAAGNAAQTPCANAANGAVSDCNSLQETQGIHTPISKDTGGGPIGAAPPSDDDIEWGAGEGDDD